MSDIEVRHDADGHRFELVVDGEVGGRADYRERDGAVVILHSEVEPRLRGRGLGNELARGTLDQLQRSGARVVPACPFFAAYIGAHPEYADMVDG